MIKKCALLLLLLSLSSFAYAQVDYQNLNPNGLINSLISNFIEEIKLVAKPIKQVSKNLFWILVPISIFLNGFKCIFAEGNIQTFFYALVKIILVIGIYLFLLDNGVEIAQAIIYSFVQVINYENYGPSEFLDLTFTISSYLYKCISDSYFDGLNSLYIKFLIGIFTVILFLCVIVFAIIYLKAHVLCIIGVFVLGFGAYEATRQYATNYLRKVISISLELLTIIVLINAGCKILLNIEKSIKKYQDLGSTLTSHECYALIFSALFMLVLTISMPKMVGSLVFESNDKSGLNKYSPIKKIAK